MAPKGKTNDGGNWNMLKGSLKSLWTTQWYRTSKKKARKNTTEVDVATKTYGELLLLICYYAYLVN